MHVVVLAGGRSTRMGEDKALMFDNVNRIHSMVNDHLGLPTVVLCGGIERLSLFKGEVWPDPQGCEGVLDVVKWVRRRINDDILMVPCDAYKLNHEAVKWLLQHAGKGGVALDSVGKRQPTLALYPKRLVLPPNANTLRSYTEALPSLPHPTDPSLFDNFNRPTDLESLNDHRM